VHAARKTCGRGMIISSVLSRRRLRSRRDSKIKDISDRLAEDARVFLLIVERQQASYDVALDGLVRDAFGSADRLRAAAAAARACGWPTAEVDLLERAADRAEQRRRRDRTRAGSAPEPCRQSGTSGTAGAPKQSARSWSGSWDEPGPVGSLEQSEPGSKQAEHA
jgi:hypothetical protein